MRFHKITHPPHAPTMRNFQILLCTLLLFPLSLYAQKNVKTKISPDETIVFIHDFQFAANDANNDRGLKSMDYDITLVTSNDSVSITSTIISKKPFRPDSVGISGLGNYAVERLYADPKGGKWANRLRFYITFQDFQRLTNADATPAITWLSGDASSAYTFSPKTKEWAKQQESWQFAIEVITENR